MTLKADVAAAVRDVMLQYDATSVQYEATLPASTAPEHIAARVVDLILSRIRGNAMPAMAEGVDIVPVTAYLVRSKDSGGVYAVITSPDPWCSCAHVKNRGPILCKHIQFAINFEAAGAFPPGG